MPNPSSRAEDGNAGGRAIGASAIPVRASVLSRLWAYQKERFPLAAYGPMVVVFTASAALYSRLARGGVGFIPWDRFAVGAFTSLVFFASLRVLDEHKDADLDRRFRPELPVPRGLVSLGELRAAGGSLLAIGIALNLWIAPSMLGPIALVAVWAALMTREFFAPEWLRAHPTAYLVSHMMIMPLIDFYTTGLDWLPAGAPPPRALGWFLALTLFNGMVVEIGRKIRAPEQERDGVDTYTRVWGLRTAPAVWLGVLALTAALAGAALSAVSAPVLALLILAMLAAAAAVPAIRFLARPRAPLARRIETVSGLWTIMMYLLLGFGTMLGRIFDLP
jgi:4-hydroxybenzoate polyprenyltransferase